MKEWRHIFFKYSRYEPCGVVLICLPSEEAVGIAILKKKSEGKVGFKLDFLMEWRQISLKYSSCTQGVMVFVSI